MDTRSALSAASRDSTLTLRRVERQQALIERLHAAGGGRVRLEELAVRFGVSTRTVARDVERLRLSGVPVRTHQGGDGGVSLTAIRHDVVLSLDLPEVAALLASLAALGPSVSDSASSAMQKLVDALQPDSGRDLGDLLDEHRREV